VCLLNIFSPLVPFLIVCLAFCLKSRFRFFSFLVKLIETSDAEIKISINVLFGLTTVEFYYTIDFLLHILPLVVKNVLFADFDRLFGIKKGKFNPLF